MLCCVYVRNTLHSKAGSISSVPSMSTASTTSAFHHPYSTVFTSLCTQKTSRLLWSQWKQSNVHPTSTYSTGTDSGHACISCYEVLAVLLQICIDYTHVNFSEVTSTASVPHVGQQRSLTNMEKEAVQMSEPPGPVVFKKRGAKGANLRKRANSEDADEGTNSSVLADIKLQQTVRQRKSGASIDILSKPSTSKSSTTSDPYESKTIESVMGTQYTSQLDYGLQVNIPHKKLMDQYIDERLGASKMVKNELKAETSEDLLYKIPENIKVTGSSSSAAAKGGVEAADNGIVPAWSMQIAEVALPISFKLKNIEATERAAALEAAKNATGPSNIAAHYRFNTNERAPKTHPSMEGFAEGFDPNAPPGQSSSDTSGQKRPLKSSDDRALDNYKKRQMNMRR